VITKLHEVRAGTDHDDGIVVLQIGEAKRFDIHGPHDGPGT
jgi:hypothetical protein